MKANRLTRPLNNSEATARRRSAQEALLERLKQAPPAHAEALLTGYDLLRGLHDRGVLDALNGALRLLPLPGLNVRELRSAMLAVDSELRAGGVADSFLGESLATILTARLIRHVTDSQRELVAADSVLPHHKLCRVIEYIIENLGGNPTVKQMAAVVDLSPYHFARQFKAATGLAPHQYVISRRVERAQHLLRTNRRLGLCEVACHSGFANQSHLCLHFKRIIGVTPRQFRENANGKTIIE